MHVSSLKLMQCLTLSPPPDRSNYKTKSTCIAWKSSLLYVLPSLHPSTPCWSDIHKTWAPSIYCLEAEIKTALCDMLGKVRLICLKSIKSVPRACIHHQSIVVCLHYSYARLHDDKVCSELLSLTLAPLSAPVCSWNIQTNRSWVRLDRREHSRIDKEKIRSSNGKLTHASAFYFHLFLYFLPSY